MCRCANVQMEGALRFLGRRASHICERGTMRKRRPRLPVKIPRHAFQTFKHPNALGCLKVFCNCLHKTTTLTFRSKNQLSPAFLARTRAYTEVCATCCQPSCAAACTLYDGDDTAGLVRPPWRRRLERRALHGTLRAKRMGRSPLNSFRFRSIYFSCRARRSKRRLHRGRTSRCA